MGKEWDRTMNKGRCAPLALRWPFLLAACAMYRMARAGIIIMLHSGTHHSL